MGERVHRERIELREAVTRTMRTSAFAPCFECHPRGQTFWDPRGVKPHTPPAPVPIAPSALLFAAGLAALLAVRGRRI